MKALVSDERPRSVLDNGGLIARIRTGGHTNGAAPTAAGRDGDFWEMRLACVAGLARADAIAIVAQRPDSTLSTYVRHNLSLPPVWETGGDAGVIRRAILQRAAQTADVSIRLADGADAGQACATPLFWRGAVVGALMALRVSEPWSPSDQMLLGRAADLVVLDIDGFNVLSDARRTAVESARRLRISEEIRREIAGADHLDAMIDRAASRLVDLFGANGVSVMLVESGGDLVVRSVAGPEADRVRQARRRLGEGISGWVALHGEPLALAGSVEDDRFRGVDPAIRSSLVAPIRAAERIVGVINVKSYGLGPYAPESLEELTLVARELGSAIAVAEAARAQSETIQSLEEEQRRALAVMDVARAAAFGTDPASDLETAVGAIGEALRHDAVGIWVASVARDRLHLRAARGYGEILPGDLRPRDDRAILAAFAEGRTQVVDDATDRRWASARASSYVIAPIFVGPQPMGLLAVGRAAGSYSPADVELISVVAGYLGGVVRKTLTIDLLQEQLMAERRKIAAELEERFTTHLSTALQVLESCQRLLQRDPHLPTQLAKAARDGRALLTGMHAYVEALDPGRIRPEEALVSALR